MQKEAEKWVAKCFLYQTVVRRIYPIKWDIWNGFTAANPALVHLIQLENWWKVKQMVRDNQSSGINRWCFYPIEKQLGMIEEDPNTSPVVMDQFETYLIDEGFKVKKKILLILHRNQLLKNWWSYTMTRTQKILLWPGTFANYSVKTRNP